MTEILPCPRCSGESELFCAEDVWVQCKKCYIFGPPVSETDDNPCEKAIELWNAAVIGYLKQLEEINGEPE